MDSTISMNDEDEDEGYNAVDVNIIRFIRHFLINRVMEKKETITLYKSIFRNHGNFEDVLNAVNNLLQKNKLNIELTTCEVTNKEYYVLFSTFYKPDQTWTNSLYTDNQLDYFQNILKQIIVSENGIVSSMDCLNLKTKLSKSDAQDFLINLIENQFLIKLSRGKLTISPLTMRELFPYFEQHFTEVLVNCEICKKSVIYSAVCPSCGIRVHKRCLAKYKSNMKKPKCPKCNTAWSADMDVDE